MMLTPNQKLWNSIFNRNFARVICVVCFVCIIGSIFTSSFLDTLLLLLMFLPMFYFGFIRKPWKYYGDEDEDKRKTPKEPRCPECKEIMKDWSSAVKGCYICVNHKCSFCGVERCRHLWEGEE